uniref:Uncharacterized protein n=1 Tax=Astyanax mexicanus TaxID=7994 RepID=A0A3B1II12_ASTMX
MESSVWTRAAACALLLLISCAAETRQQDQDQYPDQDPDRESRALRDFYPKDPNLTNQKELGALQEVLEKLQSKRISLWEKKFGRVPTCDVGEQVSTRKGARIGRCATVSRAVCNFFLLKCL